MPDESLQSVSNARRVTFKFKLSTSQPVRETSAQLPPTHSPPGVLWNGTSIKITKKKITCCSIYHTSTTPRHQLLEAWGQYTTCGDPPNVTAGIYRLARRDARSLSLSDDITQHQICTCCPRSRGFGWSGPLFCTRLWDRSIIILYNLCTQ